MLLRTLLFAVFLLLAFHSKASLNKHAFPKDTLRCEEAIQEVGTEVLLKGKVVNIIHTTSKKSGAPIAYINLDKNYPHNVLTIIIMGKFIDQFSLKRENYIGREVLIEGLLIQNGRYKPTIFLERSAQLKLLKD